MCSCQTPGPPTTRSHGARPAGTLSIIRAAAGELPVIRLDDALQVCVLLRDREPERYERAAVKWIGRYCVERPGATLDDVEHARGAFTLMRRDPTRALGMLQTL